jgi:hypothetical protein
MTNPISAGAAAGLVLAPDGTPDTAAALGRRIDNAVVKAIAHIQATKKSQPRCQETHIFT